MGPRYRLERPTAQARELRNSATEAEKLLWARLRRSQLGGLKFSRQMPVAGFVADFMCRSEKLVVELDGSQHFDNAKSDAERTRRIEAQGFRVIRFWNSDVMTNMDGVLEAILAAAEKRREREPTPQPHPVNGRGS
ncbi:endonuclease domain-containing protein [Sphingosinithalassobacter portus]|uniref:endonuclease domain-containing protein n=1 Tax=Stakelama portus TaxID=2676234 RepID=UPI000D6E4D32|nr:endonuclease domain-containing protein [Sphingosinithalassobacter portus]